MNIQPEPKVNGISLPNGTNDPSEFSNQNQRLDSEMDSEGYQPTYDEAFPELPTSNAPILRNPGPPKATNNSMQSIRATTITQVGAVSNDMYSFITFLECLLPLKIRQVHNS